MNQLTAQEKLLKRFKSKPTEFSWSELMRLLRFVGYEELKTGKTGGSRRRFKNQKNDILINLHKPHPKEILKRYQIQQILDHLEREGIL